MGVFSVKTVLNNWQNRFLPIEKQGKQVYCDALVDTGAAELALPTEIIQELKLEEVGKVRVYTADGGEHEYSVFGIVELEVQGRCGILKFLAGLNRY
jgi:predicted aspartyl protease